MSVVDYFSLSVFGYFCFCHLGASLVYTPRRSHRKAPPVIKTDGALCAPTHPTLGGQPLGTTAIESTR